MFDISKKHILITGGAVGLVRILLRAWQVKGQMSRSPGGALPR